MIALDTGGSVLTVGWFLQPIIILSLYSFWAYNHASALDTGGFESKSMSVEFACYVQTVIVFYKFYEFFCRWYSLMNWPCYKTLFQITQHANFRNLNRVIFTQWKHLEFWVHAFWYCFKAIKKYTFLFDEIGSHFRKPKLLWNTLITDTGRYQSLVILFRSSVVTLT